MEVGNKFFMQGRTVEGADNFPADTTGNIVYTDTASAHRGISVLSMYVRLCDAVPCGQKGADPSSPTHSEVCPLRIWSYYYGICPFWSVKRYTHTHTAGHHGVYGV